MTRAGHILKRKRLHLQSDAAQRAFFEHLLARLPANTHGGDYKTSKTNFIPSEDALAYHPFIRYNTKKCVTVLLFDFDNVRANLNEWYNRLYQRTGIEFSWVTATTSGIQAAIILTDPVWILDYDGNPTTGRERLKAIKRAILDKLGLGNLFTDTYGDEHGTNRMLGVWRNPTTHESIVNRKTYTDKELSYLLGIMTSAHTVRKPAPINTASFAGKMKMGSGSIQTTINKGFYIGNRNNYLFAYGYKSVFENRAIASSIETVLSKENESYLSPMKPSEVSAIAATIEKMVPTMYQPTQRKKPAKYRQFMWDNNIHGLYNRQAFGAFITAKQKRESAAQRISKALVTLFEKGRSNPANPEVAAMTNMSVRQYQRYKQNFSLKEVFVKWFAALRESFANAAPIGIRANVIPLGEESFEGRNSMRVKDKKTGVVVVEWIFDGLRWRKPDNQLQSVA